MRQWLDFIPVEQIFDGHIANMQETLPTGYEISERRYELDAYGMRLEELDDVVPLVGSCRRNRKEEQGCAGILQQTYNFDLTDTYLNGPAAYRAPRFDVFAYQFLQGTSMATPHVAGFAALLMQQGITSPAAVEAAMKKYATDLGTPGRDNEYGYGLINPRAALRGMGLAK